MHIWPILFVDNKSETCYCAAWALNMNVNKRLNVEKGWIGRIGCRGLNLFACCLKIVLFIFLQYLIKNSRLLKISRHCYIRISIFEFVTIFCQYIILAYKYIRSKTMGHMCKLNFFCYGLFATHFLTYFRFDNTYLVTSKPWCVGFVFVMGGNFAVSK